MCEKGSRSSRPYLFTMIYYKRGKLNILPLKEFFNSVMQMKTTAAKRPDV